MTLSFSIKLLLIVWMLLIDIAFSEHVTVGDRSISMQSWLKLRTTIDCWTSSEGNWTKRPDLPPLISKVYNNDKNLVTKIYSNCGPLESRKSLDYVWTPPAKCPPIYDFSFPAMCRIMRGRILVFTGDSLSLHSFETTVNALGNRTVFGGKYDGHHRHAWTQPYDCETPGFGRNFSVTYLSWNSIANRHHFPTLAQLTAEFGGAVFVANWGAFYLGDETVKAHMREIFDFVSKTGNITFIFRASNMAHLDCEKYSEPDNILHKPAPHPYRFNWHWQDFPRQGVLWKEYMDNHEIGKIFLDILPLSAKRPDQHAIAYNDCLHYCLPGPMDTWTKLIFATIYLIEEIAAADTGNRETMSHEGGLDQISHVSTSEQSSKSFVVNTTQQILELEEKIQDLREALMEEKRKNRHQTHSSQSNQDEKTPPSEEKGN